jgi:hypothetical protein
MFRCNGCSESASQYNGRNRQNACIGKAQLCKDFPEYTDGFRLVSFYCFYVGETLCLIVAGMLECDCANSTSNCDQ